MSVVFNYSVYSADYIKGFLVDNEDQVPVWFRDFLTGESTVEQNRDDDLEDYLSAQTYVPAIGVSGATQALSDGVTTAAIFDTEEFVSTDIITWSSTTNPDRLTIQQTGIYDVSGSCNFAFNATGDRALVIAINGGLDEVAGQVGLAAAGSATRLSTEGKAYLTAGDYLSLFVAQTSGGSLNLTVSRMQVAFLGSSGS